MEAIQGKYDLLATALLPLHKKITTIKEDPNELKICLTQIKENINIHNSRSGKRLKALIKMLSENNSSDEAEKHFVFLGIKNEALNILSKFFLQWQTEEASTTLNITWDIV